MKELESMYDILFDDDTLKQLFLNFHNSRWRKLNVDMRISLIKSINDRMGEIYGYKPPEITLSKHSSTIRGDMEASNWVLNIEPNVVMNYSGYMVFDTLMHELRHSYQIRAITNKLTSKETVNDEEKEAWKTNNIPGNYFVGGTEYYVYQPLEKDAWTTALLMTRRMYFLNKEILGEDEKEWNKYCDFAKSTFMHFVCENEISKEMEEEIQEIYDKKEIDKKQMILGKAIVDKLLKEENIETLSLEFTLILLSPFAFTHLEPKDKIKVLKRYVELLEGPKNFIKEYSADCVKIGNCKLTLFSSMELINVILTDVFTIKTFKRVSKLNLDIKEERDLYYNLYVDKNHKRINFIRCDDNIFLYFLQPYAKHEREYILKEFDKLREIEMKVFKKNNDGFLEIDSFYNIEKRKEILKDITGVSYEEFYDNLIEKYKSNIEKDKEKVKKGILL